jgi:hypothetical protein
MAAAGLFGIGGCEETADYFVGHEHVLFCCGLFLSFYFSPPFMRFLKFVLE